MLQYDVFLSYHGGGGDESKSSYYKAEELYGFLESRGLKCFLYKKENNEDFYDAINKAILSCKHFILVASHKEMLSTWVKEEVKQFDALYKNGKKPNAVISAYLFGDITIDDLCNFNVLFSTKDIVGGADGFEKIYKAIAAKNGAPVPAQAPKQRSFDEISVRFLDNELKSYASFSPAETEKHLTVLSTRLSCVTDNDCPDYMRALLEKVLSCDDEHIFRLEGPAGTQKSYILQMLYVLLRQEMHTHSFEPVYIHCDRIRKDLARRGVSAETYLADLFGLVRQSDREPLFIIDGVLNIVADNFMLDYAISNFLSSVRQKRTVLGVNTVFEDNRFRINRSKLFRERYAFTETLTPISLYNKEQSILYLSTLDDMPQDYSAEEMYQILNRSGLITIDEHVVRVVMENCDTYQNIMDIFELQISDFLDGNDESLHQGAALVFEFAYGMDELDFNNPVTQKIMRLVTKGRIYINCLIAIHYIDQLKKYQVNKDFSFFSIIYPKEVTRFITSRINQIPALERTIVDLGKHYNEMTPTGKSEMSFFLGRIKNSIDQPQAIQLLNQYYAETKDLIKKREVDDKYNGIPYAAAARKQDLFLLRGISVSLIYYNDNRVLFEYVKSLIANDLANSINRGFHLEYYGDKKYVPNQSTLDYEDNLAVGQKTLRLLCNTIDKRLQSDKIYLSLLLEVFTVISLLQVRIQRPDLLKFDVLPYIHAAQGLVKKSLEMLAISDPVIIGFFDMALADFAEFEKNPQKPFSPALKVCDEYLQAKNVKRTGWVAQGLNAPESITEHMYSCWLIGLIYLPERDLSVGGYDKQKILNMLLIHDLAETRLGDIPKYEKYRYPDYNERENATMLSIFLRGTYSGIDSMAPFVDAWGCWYAENEENAKIAKDIDLLQAVYQFFEYYLLEKEKFTDERAKNWISELSRMKTAHGKRIAKALILDNERFKPVLELFKGCL